MAVLCRVCVLPPSVPTIEEAGFWVEKSTLFQIMVFRLLCTLISIQPHILVPAMPNVFVWQAINTNDNTNDAAATTKPNRDGLNMTLFVPPPSSSHSFIAVGTTVTKEPASFAAAGDASSNTSHVGDHRQPPADTALTVSLQG